MEILIVDDDRAYAIALRRLLEHHGHSVSLAETCVAAWRRLQQAEFQLVFVDWLMPQMNGIELIRNCRELHADSPYFILLTSGDRRENRAEAVTAGAGDFLARPYDSNEVFSRLRIAERTVGHWSKIAKLEEDLVRANSNLERIAELDQRNIEEIRESCRALELSHVQLMQRSISDSLTGLKNHQEFQTRLADEIERANRYEMPLSVIMLDVDNFKQYNDDFGHPAGDVVLQELAHVLERQARGSDTVARYGGEEFAVILVNTNHRDAVAAAGRIQQAIADACWPKRPITVSIGISSLRGVAHTRAEMVAEADSALYNCKRLGRDRAAHSGDLSAAA